MQVGSHKKLCSQRNTEVLTMCIRKMVLEGKIAIRYEVVADIPELQKLTAEFGKIGSNLNQIARYFHTGGVRSKTMQDEIQSCISELWNLRKDVTRMKRTNL